MKKMLTSLSFVACLAATTVFALEFDSPAAHEAYIKERRERHQVALDKIQQAKENNDEAVLSEAIDLIFFIFNLEEPETSIAIVQADVLEYEISQELLIKALEHSVRTNLSILAKNELANYSSGARGSLQMLGAFENYDMLPLLQECMKSKNINIRNDATRRHKIIMERAQDKLKQTDDVTPKDDKDTSAP